MSGSMTPSNLCRTNLEAPRGIIGINEEEWSAVVRARCKDSREEGMGINGDSAGFNTAATISWFPLSYVHIPWLCINEFLTNKIRHP